jgi:lysophospholipase L1-like esterase
LLQTLRDNAPIGQALGDAEVVTWDIGGNELQDARDAFKAGACGGADNQECLRATEAAFTASWDAIVEELLALTGDATVLRAMDIYNPFAGQDQADGSLATFQPYLERINAHITVSAIAHGIAVAPVYHAFNGPDGTADPGERGYLWIDDLHPSAAGHAAIAAAFEGLGYAAAGAPANASFERTWARTDRPVAEGMAARTWMWGDRAATALVWEDYAESPDGQRAVQYYDKSRMEISDPAGDATAPWYVTNGLLVVELVTGRMQLGAGTFDERAPAEVNIAGDPGERPTYADIDRWALRQETGRPVGTVITHRIDDGGNVSLDPSLAQYGVTAAERVTVPGIDHTVASPFWAFMNARGVVYEDGQYSTANLFTNPYYATGYPITEAWWSRIAVDGQERDVLWQCFERRCLTYTPGNPQGWQVEAGNVGQHYFVWRYR